MCPVYRSNITSTENEFSTSVQSTFSRIHSSQSGSHHIGTTAMKWVKYKSNEQSTGFFKIDMDI